MKPKPESFFRRVLLWLAPPEAPRDFPAPPRERSVYEAETTPGPLTLSEQTECTWPDKQFISIKHPSDKYARWAEAEDITDTNIKYIGCAKECWLRLTGPELSGIRDYHLGLVRSRGAYHIFEIDPAQEECGPDYDWWNRPYEIVKDTLTFTIGNIELAIYRDKMPITIEGKNTDGIAIINSHEAEVNHNRIIGSAPDCWITLPDPTLPAYMAERRSLGHHKVLYAYGYQEGDQYITRADRAFQLGGYSVTL